MTEEARAAISGTPRPPRLRVFAPVAVLLALLVAWGAYGRWQRGADARETQRESNDFAPSVRVTEAKRVDDPVAMTLPGQTEPYDSASVYARATGYVAERRVDIGTRVRKGDLMLRVSAPDLDAQLAQALAQVGQFEAAEQQAEAQLQQAQANSKLANVTNQRTSTLAGEGWETKQNADNTRANVNTSTASVAAAQAGIAVAQANLRAQIATVQRLQELTGFERIVAPFDGVVTTRNVDTGDLVTADAAGGNPLLTVQRDDLLRVAVQVPQSGAVSLRDGLEATVRVPELPARTFGGRVARSSVALNPASRTLLAQVDVDNGEHVLRPGLYAEVSFAIPREAPGVVLPDEALIFNAQGMQVAVVQPDQTIAMRTVSIYRDFGTSVEVRDGLAGGERLVLSPPANLEQGSKVKVQEPASRPPGQAPSSAVSAKQPLRREKPG